MSFNLTIKGKTTINFGEKMISSAYVDVNTPADSMAKSSSTAVTLYVTGKHFSNDVDSGSSNTKELLEWSLVRAQSADAYRDVTVTVIGANESTFRKINLPNAFIVDYSERYSDAEGVGSFSLVLRQKADQIDKVKDTSGKAGSGQEPVAI